MILQNGIFETFMSLDIALILYLFLLCVFLIATFSSFQNCKENTKSVKVLTI